MDIQDFLETSSVMKDISLLRDKLNKACSEFYEENYPKLKSNKTHLYFEFVGLEAKEYYNKTFNTLLEDIKANKRTSDLTFDLIIHDKITFKDINTNAKIVKSELYDFHHLIKNKLISKIDFKPFGCIKLIKVDPEEKQIYKSGYSYGITDETIYISLNISVDLTNFYIEKNKLGDK